MRAPDVSPSSAQLDLGRREPDHESLIIDPRHGDAEDDVSSPKQKSLLAIAGSLLAEISLTKLLVAWIVSIVLPAAILGLAPLVVTAWVGGVFSRALELYGFGAALLLLAIVAVGWFGWRPLLRVAEANFWALNALGVQPGYALCREAIRHLAERSWRACAREAALPPEFFWPSSQRWLPLLFGRTRAGSDRPPISPFRII